MPARSVYQINTRVWLGELSAALGSNATLADIPDAKLDQWSSSGFDFIWFLGVWKTGNAGRRVSLTNQEWRPGYQETLGAGLREDDISGSPFAVQEYVAHPDFGGNDALGMVRERLRQRGVRLILDFVPNHMALDHAWVHEHPEFFIHGTEDDLAREPHNYCRVETRLGPRILAFGGDPYFPGWPDTLQLNYRNEALQNAMRQQLLQIARFCDGVRCDMAMLLLPDVFARTWDPRSQPADGSAPTDRAFWPDAIAVVRRDYRDFVFIAEAYWDTEWQMLQQGFDYAYDKRLYDRLVRQDAQGVRAHLQGGSIDYQRKLVRFLENHDEPRAARVFPPDVHQAAAALTFLAPGLRLFHEGQFEGRKVKVSIHLKRRPPEVVDEAILDFYTRLLACITRPELLNGNWRMLESIPHTDGDPSWNQFIVFAWTSGKEPSLFVAVNYGPSQGKCVVPLAADRSRLEPVLMSNKDEGNRIEFTGGGLSLDFPAWGYGVYSI